MKLFRFVCILICVTCVIAVLSCTCFCYRVAKPTNDLKLLCEMAIEICANNAVRCDFDGSLTYAEADLACREGFECDFVINIRDLDTLINDCFPTLRDIKCGDLYLIVMGLVPQIPSCENQFGLLQTSEI